MAPTLKHVYACSPATTRGRAVLLDGNGDKIVYTNGKTVVVRSLVNPLEVETYSEHQYGATVARFSPNGNWIASGDTSGKVRIWGNTPGKELKLELQALGGSVDDIGWSDDGQRLVAGGDGRGRLVKAFLWDTGSDLGEFAGLSKRINSVAFRPKRPYRIVTGGEDFSVGVYEGPPFKFKAAHKAHTNFVNCVRFSPDGERLASVGSDSRVLLYDGDGGAAVGELKGHKGTVYAASWSPDGARLLTASADKTVRVWDVAAGREVSSFTAGAAVEHMQVGCLWLGQSHLVSLGLSGDLTLLDPAAPDRPRAVIRGHMRNVTALAALPGAAAAVSASYDGDVLQWAVGRGCECRAAPAVAHKAAVVAAAAAPSGEVVTVGGDDTAHWARLPLSDGGGAAAHKLPGAPAALSVSAATGVALCATAKGLVLMQRDRVLSTTPLAGAAGATAVAIAPDGTEAAVGLSDNSVRLFTVRGDALADAGALEARHRGAVTALVYSPDGSMLASADANREVVVWDRASRAAKITRLVYHTAKVLALSWDGASRRLASGSLDSSIIVWDAAAADGNTAGTRVTLPLAHREGVSALAWAGDDTLLSAGFDSCVKEWALA